jgi:hypothetical protein
MLQTARYLMLWTLLHMTSKPISGGTVWDLNFSSRHRKMQSQASQAWSVQSTYQYISVLANKTTGSVLDQRMTVGQCCSETDSSKLWYEGTLNLCLIIVIYVGLCYTNSVHIFLICSHTKFHVSSSNGSVIPIESRVKLCVSCDLLMFCISMASKFLDFLPHKISEPYENWCIVSVWYCCRI